MGKLQFSGVAISGLPSILQGHFQTDSKSQKPDRGKPAGLSLVT